jgi:hypothetical protein
VSEPKPVVIKPAIADKALHSSAVQVVVWVVLMVPEEKYTEEDQVVVDLIPLW